MSAWITSEPISAESVLSLVRGDAHGATLVFLGTVRDHNEGRPVRGVYYEAYQEMAERTLREIVAETEARVAPAAIAAVHRVGELRVGDVSVAIAVATPHRAEAFDACRFAIEEIKRRLAVWKQERYRSGETEWLAGVTPPAPETTS